MVAEHRTRVEQRTGRHRHIRVRVVAAALLIALLGACDASTAPEEVKGDPRVKPEPRKTVAEFRSEEVGNDRYRVWPRSADVESSGVYHYTVEHCGLEWMVDFDASFWKAIRPRRAAGPRFSFFYNSDTGTISFRTPDDATYTSSKGVEVELRRLQGPIVIQPCE